MKFIVGQTYSTRSACDWDTVFSWKIVARTAKQLTLEQYGKTCKRGIYIYDGIENCRPCGSYSMAPIISADKKEASL